jgi:hypothetical protein
LEFLSHVVFHRPDSMDCPGQAARAKKRYLTRTRSVYDYRLTMEGVGRTKIIQRGSWCCLAQIASQTFWNPVLPIQY